MSDEPTPCLHAHIQTWRFEDSAEVAGMWSCTDCGRRFEPVAAAQTGAEPVAWQERQAKRMSNGKVTEWSGWYESKARSSATALAAECDHIPYEWRPLYAAPTAQPAPLPAREPLTDWQVDKLLDRERMKWKTSPPTHEFAAAFARAIEAAHGITASTADKKQS